MSAEEKVASEPTIEVFHQRTGSDRFLGQRGNRKLNRMEPAPELFSDGRFLGPASRVAPSRDNVLSSRRSSSTGIWNSCPSRSRSLSS